MEGARRLRVQCERCDPAERGKQTGSVTAEPERISPAVVFLTNRSTLCLRECATCSSRAPHEYFQWRAYYVRSLPESLPHEYLNHAPSQIEIGCSFHTEPFLKVTARCLPQLPLPPAEVHKSTSQWWCAWHEAGGGPAWPRGGGGSRGGRTDGAGVRLCPPPPLSARRAAYGVWREFSSHIPLTLVFVFFARAQGRLFALSSASVILLRVLVTLLCGHASPHVPVGVAGGDASVGRSGLSRRRGPHPDPHCTWTSQAPDHAATAL